MGKREDKLIYIDDINEEMRLIDGSDTDYITPTAKVYKDYGNGYFYPKSIFQNKHNMYLYVTITFSDGVNRGRRLHRLLAQAYIPNPNPNKFKYVGHKDNVKWHCSIDNLYWTTNKDNTQKAIDDKLNVNTKAENDSQSTYIKVIEYETENIVGVYGSIRQCARCVKNTSVSYIAKMCKNKDYKPRTKKYVYQESNKEEFDKYKDLQNAILIENDINNKKPKVFRMTNEHIGYDNVLDNQCYASDICGIEQGMISHLIRSNGSMNGWKFEYLGEINYKDSTAFEHLIDTVDDVLIENINTGERLWFKCKQDMLDHFDINGNAASDYFTKGFLIMHEWKVVGN